MYNTCQLYNPEPWGEDVLKDHMKLLKSLINIFCKKDSFEEVKGLTIASTIRNENEVFKEIKVSDLLKIFNEIRKQRLTIN